MQTELIQRQYNEIIAPHYDLDPQGLIGRSLTKALEQIQSLRDEIGTDEILKVLDVGCGTGKFCERLKNESGFVTQLHGLDLSEKMADIALERLPEMRIEVDCASNLTANFEGEQFGLICTHFMTSFVPLDILAPQIRDKVKPGGLWSFVGGTMAGYPALRKKADAKLLKLVFGGKSLPIDNLVTNPKDREAVTSAMESQGFEVLRSESYKPTVHFRNFNDFMEFGYRGGWLTPFIEHLGLQKAKRTTRALLNALVFPIRDYHDIEIVIGRKVR